MEGGVININPLRERDCAALKVQPAKAAHGWMLILHGYGGCKEEMLPLSVFLAGKGIPSLIADLPGHGESMGWFNYAAVCESIAGWRKRMRNEFAGAIGHSVGGRLALSLDFPRNVAISPPLCASFTGGKKEMTRVLRPRRVTESAPFLGLLEILNTLGDSLPAEPDKKGLLLVAQHDLPVVKKAAAVAPPDYYEIKQIRYSDHHDILTSRQTLESIWLWLTAEACDGGSISPL